LDYDTVKQLVFLDLEKVLSWIVGFDACAILQH